MRQSDCVRWKENAQVRSVGMRELLYTTNNGIIFLLFNGKMSSLFGQQYKIRFFRDFSASPKKKKKTYTSEESKATRQLFFVSLLFSFPFFLLILSFCCIQVLWISFSTFGSLYRSSIHFDWLLCYPQRLLDSKWTKSPEYHRNQKKFIHRTRWAEWSIEEKTHHLSASELTVQAKREREIERLRKKNTLHEVLI